MAANQRAALIAMYRLYVDEVGTDDLIHLQKDNHRYLSLTGIAMHAEYARDRLTPNLNWIKTTIFDHDPDDPVILHRTDIVKRRGVFGLLSDPDKESLFNRAILRLMHVSEYKCFTALVDKQWMVKQRHWIKTHPYHYLLEILVEKYTHFLRRAGCIGDIMPEARQGVKDATLQAVFEQIKEKGTRYKSASEINDVIRGSKLKFRSKKQNISGLQLCDLIAHPSHINTRSLMGHDVSPGKFCQTVVEILKDGKYDRATDGCIRGYGIKHLP